MLQLCSYVSRASHNSSLRCSVDTASSSDLDEDHGIELEDIPGWTVREPLSVAEKEHVWVEASNPSGSMFTLESAPEAGACAICAYDRAEEVLRKSAYTIQCKVKLSTRGLLGLGPWGRGGRPGLVLCAPPPPPSPGPVCDPPLSSVER